MEATCFNSWLGGVRQSSGRGSRSVCATVSPWGVSWAASHVRNRQERKLVERRSCHDARLQRTVLALVVMNANGPFVEWGYYRAAARARAAPSRLPM